MGRTWDTGADASVTFESHGADSWGEDHHGRRWRIAEERTGWRLSFLDPGDATPTNAGVHRTRLAAEREANRSSALPHR